MSSILMYLKFMVVKRKWKKKNSNNFTKPKHYCDVDKIDIGKYTYGTIDAESFGTPESRLSIGNYCSIAQNVRFILDGEHDYRKVSTYPFKVRLLGGIVEAICKGPIVIHDDVWIGERAIILSGVDIGQGAIVGAGSIVTHDIPPYAIYAGNRVVKYRFDQKTIEKLMELDYSKLDISTIKDKLDYLYTDVEKLDCLSIW